MLDVISAPSSLAWINGAGTLWSPGAFSVLGLPSDLSPSLDLFMSFVHPEDQRRVAAFCKGGGFAVDGEVFFRIVPRDGTLKPVSLVALDAGSGCDRLCLFDYSVQFGGSAEGGGGRGSFVDGDGLPIGLWAIPDPVRDLTLSAPARLVLGLAAGERLSVPQFTRQVHPEDRERWLDRIADGRADEPFEPLLVRISRLDTGEERQVEITTSRPGEGPRSAIGLWGTICDVTDRAREARLVQQAEASCSASLDRVSDGVLVLDRSGLVRRVNPAGRDMLGLDIAPGQIFWEVRPGLVGDALWRAIKTAAERGVTVREEQFVPALDRWVNYSAACDGDLIVLTLRDRNEVHRLNYRFADLSERCSTAFRFGHMAIWELDMDTRKLWFADASRRVVGACLTSVDEFRTSVVPDDLALIDDTIRTALADRKPFEIEFRTVRGEGRIQRLQVRGGLTSTGPEGVSRLTGIAMDVGRTDLTRPARAPQRSGSDQPQTDLAGSQVRAARGALRWSVRELAEHSRVSVATINRFEAGSKSITARDSSVSALRRVLVQHGISFFTTPDGDPAVSISPRQGGFPVGAGPQNQLASVSA